MEGSGQGTGREQGELFIPSMLRRDAHAFKTYWSHAFSGLSRNAASYQIGLLFLFLE